MITERTIYKCDLCHEETSAGRIFRVQHLVGNTDLGNIKPAGIKLYTIKETIAFGQASTTCVCFSCCGAIRTAIVNTSTHVDGCICQSCLSI